MENWVAVATTDEIKRARKKVVDVEGTAVVLFWHDENVYALRNICIHRQRELVKGVILRDRIVCPGHQWAFNLQTGYEENMCRYQPTYDVRIDGETVYIDPAANHIEELEESADPADRTATAEGPR